MTVWCMRCNRSFGTYQALDQHTRYSGSHFECEACNNFDGESWSELLDHYREEGCRTACQGCNDGQGASWVCDSEGYWQHVQVDNVCTMCERHFDTPSNLVYHKLTHKSAMYRCISSQCDRLFKTYGGMIIHLESGACESGIDKQDLYNTAANSYSWPHFIDEEYHDHLLGYTNLENYFFNEVYPFKCPTCDDSFSKLSSLFQHVESPRCGQTLNHGHISRLRNYLKAIHN
ncbi:hypothetical protein K504DRAFT_484348 [Pleomassaria siparia CBS 279.74]|uniref:C2H2-type domain-containing protein n=1 Tax=Pleomassaria siparia CBS 279.74 TaxID=1314801 RepID=A0A6G1JZL0_9PLEO|nr:hypothetical protein K504DRAFT_484348 [Pleomassaria siparia CBS 279.74]